MPKVHIPALPPLVPPTPGKIAWPAMALAMYSLAYFFCLFHPGLIRYDDFGYLQSVIGTFARARPFTHDWLAPYNATLSLLSAAAYHMTGNFPLSTWGLQSVFVLASFLILYRLIRSRLSPFDSACLALLMATQPVYWYKCGEFSGNAFTYTFVLGALAAYRREGWIPFFLLAFLAFANRQNNVALMALPVWHLLSRHRGPGIRVRILGLLAFAAGALLLHDLMNRTFAQTHSIYDRFDAYRIWGVFQAVLVGAFIGLAFLSLFGVLMAGGLRLNLRKNLANPRNSIIATCMFLLIPALGSFPLVSFQFPLIASLDYAQGLQWAMMLLVGGLLWTLDWKALQLDAPHCMGGAYILISSLRGFWFDVYLLDVALAALLCTLSRESLAGMGRWIRMAVLMILACHLGWSYAFKILSDKNMLAIRAYEALERKGRISVDQMTDAPFGYLGWKLFDHHIINGGGTLSGFLGYVEREQVVFESELPWRRGYRRGLPQGAEVLQEGRARIGFFLLGFRVMDLNATGQGSISPEGALTLDRESYRPRPFPLDRLEWSRYLSASPTGP